RSPHAAKHPACASTSLRVNPARAQADFNLAAAPAALALTAGGAAGIAALTVTSRNGFNGKVTYSVLSAPTGVDVTFAPNANGANASIAAALTAPLGASTVQIAATSGRLRRTVMVQLTIAAPVSTFTGTWRGPFQANVATG